MERLFLPFLLPLSFSKHKRSLHAFLVNRLKVDREETLSDGERTLRLSPQFSSRDAEKGVDKASCHSIPPPRAVGALLCFPPAWSLGGPVVSVYTLLTPANPAAELFLSQPRSRGE